MRQLICLVLLTTITTTILQAQNRVHWSQLDNNHGKIYQRNHIEPFSGVAFDEYEPGKKKGMVSFKDGFMHGKATQWDMNGKKLSESTYVKGKKEGKETVYHQNGKKRLVVNYINDKPHGLVIEYYETGEKMSYGEVMQGVENGKHTWWFKSGQKDQELTYRMGSVEGTVKNWYPDGKQKMIAEYKKNQKHGTTTNWFVNGNKMSIQHYFAGIETDTSSFWTKKGRLKEQKIYNRRGEMIDHRSFQEASILAKDGYLHVYNKLNSNFILQLKGKKVAPVNTRVLAFYVDGTLVQIYTAPKKDFEDDKTKSNIDILKRHQEFDVDRLEALLSDDSTQYDLDLTAESLSAENGSDMVFWKFEAPGKSEEKQLTLVEEQYLSIICQNHILLLNGMVFRKNKPEDVKAQLIKIANSIILKDEPIDVIDLSEKQK